MGREIKRVPLDFSAPSDQTWEGYVMPERLNGEKCLACDGRGDSPQAKHLSDLWYGYVPFKPEDNGSAPLTIDTPAVRAFAERNVAHAPEFYGEGEWAIQREARRLADIWNSQWSHHLNEQDIADAIAHDGSRWELTHDFVRGEGWQPKNPAIIPTPAEVQAWSIDCMSTSGLLWSIMKARLERAGDPAQCLACGGEGTHESYPGQRAEADAWERYEPPTGEGWQMWQTVSDAPLSPVFETAEGLIEWMTSQAAAWGAMDEGWSRENAEAFVHGPGWAPTFVEVAPGLLVDGVTAVTNN